MNTNLRTAMICLGALILWSSGGGIATAHTGLASSDPAKDATVTGSPDAIVLTFTEDINPSFAHIVVSSADGRNWVSGSPRVEGSRLTASVAADRPGNGEYTVGYRVVSADGHPVTGSFGFTIAGVLDEPSAPSPSSPAATSTAPAAPQPAAPAGADTKTSVLTAAVAGLALGGVIAFWQSRKRRRRTADRLSM
ncbi:MAG: copper resistance CopC family protein [Mycobacterium sp.]